MTDADALTSDMTRLSTRPYSEVGVPMFVIAQDLAATEALRASTATAGCLAERYAELVAAFASQNSDPTVVDVARLVQVFADRHLLEIDGPRFTLISDGAG